MKTKKEALEEVSKEILADETLLLKKEATNLVFGKGNPEAEIMFIAEAPGKQEDQQGIPFVGRAGKLLDELLASINLTEDNIYIANILKYRPPKNRDPNEEEIKAHTPYLIKQILIIQPKVIVTLGNYATKFILANCDPKEMTSIPGITTLHGKTTHITFNNNSFKVIPTFHPAALIYNQKLRPTAEQDFQLIKEETRQKI
jgi:uracil-DNA glycosylase